MVSFPLAFRLFLPAYLDGAVRAVFGAVGTGPEQCPAYGAPFRVQPVKQGSFQFLVQWQHRRPEPSAQQGVGNALDTDTFLTIVQRNAVAAVIITALMHQPPRAPVLLVVHDGNGFMPLSFHSVHGSGTQAAAPW